MAESGKPDSAKLIELQNRIKNDVKFYMDKIATTVLTRVQKSEILVDIQTLLDNFVENHNKILEVGKPDIPYIVNCSGEKTIANIQKFINDEQSPLSEPPLPAPNPSVQKSSRQQQQQVARIRKLDYKINQLFLVIDEIARDLSTTMVWNKELFECKNRFLFEQWNAISLIEEEIVLNEIENAPLHDDRKCPEAYRKLNDAIKSMSSKLTPVHERFSRTSNSKLPDLKVPIFKGDYRKWSNFKDLFETLIHNNEQLTAIQKMEYLKTYLEDEPLRLISAYTLSAENYNDAFMVLKNRYDDKRKLLNIHFDNMFRSTGQYATSSAMKNLHDGLKEGITAIRNMGIDNSSWSPIILYFATSCLDGESKALYEQRCHDQGSEIPELEDFLNFLEGRFKTLEIKEKESVKITNNHNLKVKNYHVAEKTQNDRKLSQCPKCDANHKLFMCPQFLALSVRSRYKFVKSVNICINCLQKHVNKGCESTRTCKQCNKFHNTLLHFSKAETSKNEVKFNNQVSATQQVNSLAAIGFNTDEILATARVVARDIYGNPVTIRVLIDTGAQRNFITEGMVQKLRLKREPYTTDVTGIGQVVGHKVKSAVDISMQPEFPSAFDMELKALVMGKTLTGITPTNRITEKFPKEWPTLNLADATFREPNEIDMILGASTFTKIILPEVHRSSSSGLIALNSQLGWLVLGETKTKGKHPYEAINSMISHCDSIEDLSRFWEIEDIPSNINLCEDDDLCEKYYMKTYQRKPNGHYVVNIPFKEDLLAVADLPTSYNKALSRFYMLEKRFEKDTEYARAYKQFIDEYIHLGHMELDINKDISDSGYYIPHHAVIKPDSSTTKLRVVFDASLKTKNNYSLNQLMMPGPRLQEDLSSILLRWRVHRYVITGDVEKMYRQIEISSDHQRYQKIFWREDPLEPVKIYRLTTVTYGTTAAPYLAVKTLQQLATDDAHRFPLASPIAMRDFYVDDILTGADKKEECIKLRNELQLLLQGGGFNLRKWASNNEDILKSVDINDISKDFVKIQDNECDSMKTLGIIWKPKEDVFSYKVADPIVPSSSPTKRQLSSDICKIFDPLGWLAPMTVTAKMIFQQTWKSKIDWNEPLPSEIFKQYQQFKGSLSDIEKINIPRWVSTQSNSSVELHGFSDASQHAYAAVIYVRSTTEDGEVNVKLLAAKTKVVPLKQHLSIARLELCGALLLARLYNFVIKACDWKEKSFTAWCDSQITLAWIKGDCTRWKTFVANRVSEIKSITNQCTWNYVPTKDNPADVASRGILPNKLKENTQWWNGPKWLCCASEFWPINKENVPENIPDQKSEVLSCPVIINGDSIENIVSRFSSYDKLKIVMAYCLRFINNCRHPNSKSYSTLTVDEIQSAENVVIRQTQILHFNQEIQCIKNKIKINNKSKLKRMNPMLCDMDFLRVNGRLQNASMTYDEKHPIILPRQSGISRLLVLRAHKQCNHGLNSLTEYILKRKFWIIKCKDLIKNVIFRCVVCQRSSPQAATQLMGQLPVPRVHLVNAFYYTGVDFAGPFDIKMWKGRCNKRCKAYVCVFVCMTVKAIHLELVSDLSAEAFLAAYRRFSSRRGPCLHLYSDCGTNFVGAANIFKKDLLSYRIQWNEQMKPLLVQGVQWHFNPPANPHAGGLWEAGVKSMKAMLFKHLGNTLLTYEEFSTVLVQIEGSLNSRPLCVLSNDIEDQSILTPSHFLVGRSTFSNPEPENHHISLGMRWKYLQSLRQQMINDFKHQYVHQLHMRNKWNETKANIQPRDVVLVNDKTVPSSKWPLALVDSVQPGSDGLTRVVNVKMESGKIMKRPITKVCRLPVLDKDQLELNPIDTPHPSLNVKTNDVNKSKHNYNLRPRKIKSSSVSLWASILCMMSFIGVNSSPIEINQFQYNSGLVFAKVADMKLARGSWTMMMFYNMSSFFAELADLDQSVQLFSSKCSLYLDVTNFCTATFIDIKQQLIEIEEDSEILLEMNHEIDHPLQNIKTKRSLSSLLPFVGKLQRAAFGTLDEDYGREIESLISSLSGDNQHLLNLIKNQTSIMETFLQQSRLSADKTRQQFQWVSNSLETLENSIRDVHSQNVVITRLQFIAAHLTARAQHLSSIQSAIIQAVTSAHHGNLRGLLHPQEFKKQLLIIKSSLPSELSIPITNNNLLKLYSLLSVKTRVSKTMIIFKFSLPLVSTNKYEIYKPIPLPFVNNDKLMFIQPTTEYFVISTHRDRFMEMSAMEFAACDHLDEATSLCEEHHPELKNVEAVNSCEMKIFTHQQHDYDRCKLITTTIDQLWIQLPSGNQWVFYVQSPQNIHFYCETEQFSKIIQNQGILKLKEECSFEHKTFLVPRFKLGTTTIYQNSLYFPEVNLTIPEQKQISVIKTNVSSIMMRQTDNFENLHQALSSIRAEEYLKTTLSSSDQLSISSFIMIIIFIAIAGGYSIFYHLYRAKSTQKSCNQETEVQAPDSTVNTVRDDISLS